MTSFHVIMEKWLNFQMDFIPTSGPVRTVKKICCYVRQNTWLDCVQKNVKSSKAKKLFTFHLWHLLRKRTSFAVYISTFLYKWHYNMSLWKMLWWKYIRKYNKKVNNCFVFELFTFFWTQSNQIVCLT